MNYRSQVITETSARLAWLSRQQDRYGWAAGDWQSHGGSTRRTAANRVVSISFKGGVHQIFERGGAMLVLARNKGESIMIGDGVVVTVIDVRGERIRLGVEAPRTVAVDREEVRRSKDAMRIADAAVR